MENVIYNELRIRGYNVDVGVVSVTKRDESGKTVRKQVEVDFVCNLGSKRYYIQSAYSIPDEQKRDEEIRPFHRIDDFSYTFDGWYLDKFDNTKYIFIVISS